MCGWGACLRYVELHRRPETPTSSAWSVCQPWFYLRLWLEPGLTAFLGYSREHRVPGAPALLFLSLSRQTGAGCPRLLLFLSPTRQAGAECARLCLFRPSRDKRVPRSFAEQRAGFDDVSQRFCIDALRLELHASLRQQGGRAARLRSLRYTDSHERCQPSA
jgi:hypothetical protein